METLHDLQQAGEIVDRHAGVGVHLRRRGLQKTVVIDVADDQLGQANVARLEVHAVELADKMLLQRFLVGNGIEKELAAFFLVVVAAAVAAALRHVLAPFFVQLGEVLELLFEIVVFAGAIMIFRGSLRHFLFQHRVGL